MSAIPEQLHGDLEASYRAHYPRLHRRARRWLPPEEAEDLVQETFLRAWRHHGGNDPGVPWLMTVLRNLAIDRSRRIHPLLTDDPLTLDGEAEGGEPSDTIVAFEDRRRVREALQQLTGGQRAAITLREWGGLSQREIAASLGTTEHSVESLLQRGRRRLRSILHGAMGLVLWPTGNLWRRLRGTSVPESAAATGHAWSAPLANLATAATVIVAGAALPSGGSQAAPRPLEARVETSAPSAADQGVLLAGATGAGGADSADAATDRPGLRGDGPDGTAGGSGGTSSGSGQADTLPGTTETDGSGGGSERPTGTKETPTIEGEGSNPAPPPSEPSEGSTEHGTADPPSESESGGSSSETGSPDTQGTELDGPNLDAGT